MREPAFCLQSNEDGKFSLNVYHAYYYQVQAQIKFSCANYADFVVWREGELAVQRIYPDEPFITAALDECKQFTKIDILPELMGKYYSKVPISILVLKRIVIFAIRIVASLTIEYRIIGQYSSMEQPLLLVLFSRYQI